MKGMLPQRDFEKLLRKKSTIYLLRNLLITMKKIQQRSIVNLKHFQLCVFACKYQHESI